MSWLWKSSIARNLLGGFLAFLLPLIIISVMVSYTSMSILRDEVMDSYRSSMQLLTEQLNLKLSKFESLAISLATDNNIGMYNQISNESITSTKNDIQTNYERMKFYKDLIEKLKAYSNINDFESNITVFFINKGRSFSSRNDMGNFQRLYIKKEFYSHPQNFNRWIIRTVNDSGMPREVLSYIAGYPYAIVEKNIIITIDIDISKIRDFISNLKSREGGTTFFIHRQGFFIVPQDIQDMNIEGIIKEIIRRGEIPEEEQADLVYKNQSVNYRIIFKKTSTEDMVLAMLIPEESMMKPLTRISKWILIVLLTSILLAIFFAYFTYRNLLLPIYKLLEGMKEASKGNMNVRIPENRKEELGFIYTQFNRMIEQINTLINEVYMEHLNRQQVQLKLLQSQINPHFLYNCLNFIYQMSMRDKNEGSARMAMYLGEYFRFATRSNRDIVTLKEELKSIDAYMQIQMMRYPDKIAYYTDISQELEDITIPRLSIQPIIENAVVHGIENSKNPGNIWVTACKNEGKSVITVEDDGKGVTPEKADEINKSLTEMNKEEAGYGISNTHWRLRLKFGESAGVSIEPRAPRGTRVILEIPDQKEVNKNA